ncbi:MAG: hypothetical protein ACO3A2_09930 [Bdellovibrionia bacterium]
MNLLKLSLLGLGIQIATSFSCALSRAGEPPFSFHTDLTYASSYVTDGFSIGGDRPVFQISAQIKSELTGLSLIFWSSLAADPAHQRANELDFFLHGERNLFAGKPYELNLHGFYDYWIYPNRSTSLDWYGNPITLPTKQGNKLQAGVALTRLIPLFGSHLIPIYNLYYWLYWNQNQAREFQGGARHELLVRYTHLLPELIPALSWPHFEIASSVNYHTGAFGVKPGLSHTTAHFKLGAFALGFLFSIGWNHQWSYEPTVNAMDRSWSTLTLSKSI